MYLGQLEKIAQTLGAPLITGETPVRQREKLFDQCDAVSSSCW